MGLPWMQPDWLLGFGVIMVRLIAFLAVLPTFPGSAFGLRMRGIIALWLAWLFQLASPLEVVDVGMSWAVYELTASASHRRGARVYRASVPRCAALCR